ncbi:NEP1-interacting protein 2-like [Canna indica]|uniref:NEP1-interacting protein 2-like n=1 Tax=Canna indica TaxID=4628 RepID=A0AAQ3KRK9_9LILI|nr:NEP1-interacting protein 2-like [Canna indica]
MDGLLLSRPSSPSSSSSRQERQSNSGGSSSDGCTVSGIIGSVLIASITCVVTVVGSIVGAIVGALIGLATESGLLRGAGIGAISGAVFCIEAVESSLDLWNSRESGISSVLYVIDIIYSLFTGRIVCEKVNPAVQSAVQSQMSAVNLPFTESPDLFMTDNSTGGLSRDFVEKLPKIKVTAENLKARGEKFCCSVCLQDFQIRELARSLPQCEHMFHLPCIDSWLIRQGSCPLCRRDI